jgi:sporulation protein YlmC with PRC-barrel domain
MEMRSEQTRQRYALLSELDDKNVICRGEACGEIEQTIIECREGRVAFIVIDPDENFLGIADTSRLVPFEVLGVTTGDEVRLDATKDMVLSSREMPDDLQTLDKTACESIYNAFGIKHPKSRNTPMSWRTE